MKKSIYVMITMFLAGIALIASLFTAIRCVGTADSDYSLNQIISEEEVDVECIDFDDFDPDSIESNIQIIETVIQDTE